MPVGLDIFGIDVSGILLTGIGALMAGAGALLTGIAALRGAKKAEAAKLEAEQKEAKHVELPY
jgi:hypothetical protein